MLWDTLSFKINIFNLFRKIEWLMTITSNGMGATRYNASVETKYYVGFLNSKSRGF
jgi:hypothetical protein